MEEAQNQSQGISQPQEDRVSFPTVGGEKKGSGAKTLLIIGILVLVGILGYVIYKSATGKGENLGTTVPTPYQNLATPMETAAPIATPTSSPSASVDKTKVKIQIQNGTGITGEAAYLQTQLSGLGYTNVTVGNSSNQNETATTASFASTVPASVVTEITTKLNSVYQSVTKETLTSTTYDIVIVTGPRKGASPKASASPTPTP